jgi:hypothetical protein
VRPNFAVVLAVNIGRELATLPVFGLKRSGP